MKTKEIKHLLETFYEGESTMEEEAYLRQFFSGEVPAELKEEKEYFSQLMELEEKENCKTPHDLEKDLDHWFESLETSEYKPAKRTIRFIWTAIAGAAAMVALVWIFYFQTPSTTSETFIVQTTLSEEEKEELVRALETVSYNLNKGLDELKEIPKTLELAQEMFNNK
jgi:hypothetical protein